MAVDGVHDKGVGSTVNTSVVLELFGGEGDTRRCVDGGEGGLLLCCQIVVAETESVVRLWMELCSASTVKSSSLLCPLMVRVMWPWPTVGVARKVLG